MDIYMRVFDLHLNMIHTPLKIGFKSKGIHILNEAIDITLHINIYTNSIRVHLC